MYDKLTEPGKAFFATVCLTMFLGCGASEKFVSQESPSPTLTPTASPDSNTRKSDVFVEREAEFTRLPAKVQLAKEPYIKGKIVVYEKLLKIAEKDVTWTHYTNFGFNGYDYDEKFKNIYAKTPEETQTVVLNSCQQIKLGDYEIEPTGGGDKRKLPGLGWKCGVTLIDRTIPAVVYRKTFESERSVLGPVVLGKVYGKHIDKIEIPPPTLDIQNFLGGLPRN